MKITFNGTEYDGIEQMPPDVRQQYLEIVRALGDADGNGVPDVLEKTGSPGVITKESIVFNKREYKSREELPPEARELLDKISKPQTGENAAQVEVSTTKVFPPRVTVSERWIRSNERPRTVGNSGFPWLLIGGLVLAILILLLLWLSGIKPGDLLRR